MRLAAYITTFDRPRILEQTLLRFLGQSYPPEYVLIIDNGQNPETEQVARSFDPSRVGYHRMGWNSGPAGAGAYGLRRLADEGFDWIACGDDDDPPLTSDTLETLMRVAQQADPPAGAVGITGTSWNWARGERAPVPALPQHGIVYVDIVGGSKLLTISRAVVEKVGVHDAALFFGQDDYEYCLRIRRAGFRIAVDAALFRQYLAFISSGTLTPKILPPDTPRPRNELWRQYYNTRNHIHFMLREFECRRLAHREAARAIARVARSWTYGPSYGMAFSRLQVKGVIDGYLGRMGRTVLPNPKSTNPG